MSYLEYKSNSSANLKRSVNLFNIPYVLINNDIVHKNC